MAILLTTLSCSEDNGTEPTNTKPAAVADLTGTSPTSNSIILIWTAPGSDGNSGTAAQYDIRYSTSPMSSATWASATEVTSEPVPKTAGGKDTCVVAGLSPITTYYFALKTADEGPSWSALSNVAMRSTTLEGSWIEIGWLGPSNLNEVRALTTYSGQVIAGGSFTMTSDVPAQYIAAWNGSSWSALGSGLNGLVNALTAFDGQLIAGGYFDVAGGVSANGVAAWNGNAWSSLGSELSDCLALTTYTGQLVAGCTFTDGGGVPTNCAAAWNGSSWSVLGSVTGGVVGDGVNALAVYNNQLIAGGEFAAVGGVSAHNIAAWNGSSWSPLGLGMDEPVSIVAVYNGQVIAGGLFFTAGGVSANHIAAWDGSSWSPLDSGVTWPQEDHVVHGNISVQALASYNGQLIAGGWFDCAGGFTAHRIAAWNGSSWSPLGSGVAYWDVGPDYAIVSALTVFNDQLIAGGNFRYPGGNIAAWEN